MLSKLQTYDELQKDVFVLRLKQTIFMRKHYPTGEATYYFRLMTPSVDQSDSNELMTQRPVASLINRRSVIWLAAV